MNKLIAVLGGTFDPIHQGHLAVAQQVYQQLPVEEVRFIPCYQSPTREPPIATPEQRLAMVKLATADCPHYIVDEREICRQHKSYTIETLNELKREQKENVFALVLGIDAFMQFERWKDWRSILDLAHLIIINRPGYSPHFSTELNKLVAERKITAVKQLRQQDSGTIYFLTMSPNTISATQVREKILKKQPVNALLPEPVYLYIHQQQLYQ